MILYDILRYTGRALFWLAAVCVLAFGVLLLGLRLFVMPNIDEYKPKLIEYLQKSTGQTVTIGRLKADWEGWNPHFILEDFALKDGRGATTLKLAMVEQTVSWRSLVERELILRYLQIEGPGVTIRRDRNNKVSVAGMGMDDTSEAPRDPAVANWILKQHSVSIRGGQVEWIDDFRKAPPIRLTDLNLRLVNSGSRHQVGVQAKWSDAVASPVDLRAEVYGDDLSNIDNWSGRLYLRLDRADIARTRLWLPLPFPVQSGQGGVRAWFGFEKGVPRDVTADLQLDNVVARLPSAIDQIELGKSVKDVLPPLKLSRLSGRFAWTEAHSGGKLSTWNARNVQVTAVDGQQTGAMNAKVVTRRDANGAWLANEAEFDQINLAALGEVWSSVPLPSEVRTALGRLHPSGRIGKTRLQWQGSLDQPQRYQLDTRFDDVSVRPFAPIPSATGLTGTLTATASGGQVVLSAKRTELELNSVFTAPVVFDSLDGVARWDYAKSAESPLRVEVERLSFANADTAGSARGTWQRVGPATAQNPGALDLTGELTRGSIAKLPRYLPLSLDKETRHWIAQALPVGEIKRAGFVVRGDLKKFPFPNDEGGQFQIDAEGAGVTVDYLDRWPKITDAQIKFSLQGTRLQADASEAIIFDLPAKNLKVAIPNLDANNPRLSIVGEVEGDTQKMLNFVESSPVGEMIGHATKDYKAQGNAQLRLGLEILLGQKTGHAVRGDVALVDNTLDLGPDVPPLEQVRGRVSFTEREMSVRELTARALGGPATVTVQQADGVVTVQARGKGDVARIRDRYTYPLMDRMSGELEWQFEQVLSDKEVKRTVQSNLVGVKVDLPAPFGKPTAQERAFKLTQSGPADGKSAQLDIDYGREVHWAMRLEDRGNGLAPTQGRLNVNAGRAQPQAPGIAVEAKLGTVDLDDAIELVESVVDSVNKVTTKPTTNANAAGKPNSVSDTFNVRTVNVQADKAIALSHILNKATVNATPQGEAWRFDLTSDEARGRIEWEAPKSKADGGKIRLRLDNLRLPEPAPVVATVSPSGATAPQTEPWPDVDLVAQEYEHKGKRLGKLELQAQAEGRDWRIKRFSVTNPDAVLTGEGLWSRVAATPSTQMQVKLDVLDAGRYLKRLGVPEGVSEAPTQIAGELRWPGSPGEFSVNQIDGELSLQVGKGRFTRADPGIAKLLGVLSLQSLARRLVLDFRDVFADGYAFDEAKANLKVQRGQLRTDNFDIAGPAARVEIRGQTSLAAETQRLDVRVLPSLSTSVAITAGVVTANPLVGAGVLLAQTVAKDPVERWLSQRYQITGTWSDPQFSEYKPERAQ